MKGKRRKRLAVLLAFGLLSALFVATSSPAAADTDSQNLFVHCGFTPGWGNQNSTSAFAADVSITAPNSVNAGDTFQVLVDINDNVNGPVPVAAGVLDFSADVIVSGAAASPGTVGTDSFINGTAIPAGGVSDFSPGSLDEDTPGTYDGLVVDVTAGSNGGVIDLVLDIGKIRPGPTAGGVSLDCSYSDNADSAAGSFIKPAIQVNVVGPSVTVDSVDAVGPGATGQTVTTHARPGVNSVSLSGANFAPSTALTAEICDTGAPAGDASCVSAAAAPGSTDGSGAFSGVGIIVDGGETIGARDIVVSDGANTINVPFTILGARSLAVSPNPGSLNTSLSLTGSNWDPGETITIEAYDAPPGPPPTGGALTTDGGSATVDSNGNISDSITLTDAATAFLLGVEAEFNPGLGVFSGTAGTVFAVSAESCTVPDGGSCDVDQTVLLEILPGELTQSLDSADGLIDGDGVVDLGSYQLDGLNEISVSGPVDTIEVIDARGTSVGWTLNGSITDLVNGPGAPGNGDNTIEAVGIVIVPTTCTPGAGSGVSTVGTPSTASTLLCQVAAGEGNGSWQINATIGLDIPVNQNAGNYTGTFTTTLS